MRNARKFGCVAGRRRLSQNGSVVDAIEQAHAEDLTGPYPNRWRNAGPIAVATIDEAEAVALLTDFEFDRLNPAGHADHLLWIFKNRPGRAAPPLRPRRRWPRNPRGSPQQRLQQADRDRAP